MKIPSFGAMALLMIALYGILPAQHPSGYGEVKGRTNAATFSFPDLNREIVRSFPVSFYAPELVSMRFRVLIRPDGSVKYVKPILDPAVPADFRLGGAHALYKFQFSPQLEELGDQWGEAVMEVGNTLRN